MRHSWCEQTRISFILLYWSSCRKRMEQARVYRGWLWRRDRASALPRVSALRVFRFARYTARRIRNFQSIATQHYRNVAPADAFALRLVIVHAIVFFSVLVYNRRQLNKSACRLELSLVNTVFGEYLIQKTFCLRHTSCWKHVGSELALALLEACPRISLFPTNIF